MPSGRWRTILPVYILPKLGWNQKHMQARPQKIPITGPVRTKSAFISLLNPENIPPNTMENIVSAIPT